MLGTFFGPTVCSFLFGCKHTLRKNLLLVLQYIIPTVLSGVVTCTGFPEHVAFRSNCDYFMEQKALQLRFVAFPTPLVHSCSAIGRVLADLTVSDTQPRRGPRNDSCTRHHPSRLCHVHAPTRLQTDSSRFSPYQAGLQFRFYAFCVLNVSFRWFDR